MTAKEIHELLSKIFDNRYIIVHSMSEGKAKEKGFQITDTEGTSTWPIKNYILEGEGNFDFSQLASYFKDLNNFQIRKNMLA
jgi:hypothetical protein